VRPVLTTCLARRAAIAALICAAALGAGCGSDDEGTSSGTSTVATTESSTTTTTQTAEGSDISGRYTRVVTRSDIERTEPIRRELEPDQPPPKPGRRLLTIAGPTLVFRDPAHDPPLTIRQDVFAAPSGRLQLGRYRNPRRDTFCASDIPQQAVYSWQLSGRNLLLTATEDPCAVRDAQLTGLWKRR
jgi:hypothetical protein